MGDQKNLAFEVLMLGSCGFFAFCKESNEDSKLSKK